MPLHQTINNLDQGAEDWPELEEGHEEIHLNDYAMDGFLEGFEATAACDMDDPDIIFQEASRSSQRYSWMVVKGIASRRFSSRADR